MKKRILIVVVTVLILFVLIASIGYTVLNQRIQKPFYVGVTYCGRSIEEAKELVDKVKDYTNLFILLSGTLRNATDIEEIGDYAITSGLNFAVYYSSRTGGILANGSDVSITEFVSSQKQKWGEQFIGIYYMDEPGGRMLDMGVILEQTENGDTRRRIGAGGGSINVVNSTNDKDGNFFQTSVTFYQDGKIIYKINGKEDVAIAYYPDGTITITITECKLEYDEDDIPIDNVPIINVYTAENITKYTEPIPSYAELLEQKPIQNYDDAANAYVNMNKELFEGINKKQLNEHDISVFTADYGLYWWDYRGGYDVVLAELAWNHSVTQHIGLVRGAANLQGKSWGTIITWKYTHAPYPRRLHEG
jgi:hypothetical protein